MATVLRWLVFCACASVLVLPTAWRTFGASERYGHLTDIMPADWQATNVWLDSTDCTLRRGAWLAVCEGDRLVPISERAIADDPGHALLLEAWSALTGRRATLVDVARLNTLADAVGLLALAALVFAVRASGTALLFLWLAPEHYLVWMGVSPHWSFIGLVSLAAVLPLAVAARGAGLLSPRAAAGWIAAGVLALALATLLREAIGLMGLLVTGATAAVLLGPRATRGLAVIALLLALLGLMTPRAVVAARDAWLPMQPAERVATHGLSHTLYLGLGVVENKWDIRYDDDYGAEVAAGRDPTIVFGSPAYFRLMGQLWRERWLEDPLEVLRIYVRKGALLLASDTLGGPPFGVLLGLALLHLVVATALGAWPRIGFVQGLVVESIAVAFLLLFLAQAMAALPDHTYAMPANAFLVLAIGAVSEFFLRAALQVRRAA